VAGASSEEEKEGKNEEKEEGKNNEKKEEKSINKLGIGSTFVRLHLNTRKRNANWLFVKFIKN
jgi:hypothetical protein